jgi:flagellar basal body P-ring formation protein FlgA
MMRKFLAVIALVLLMAPHHSRAQTQLQPSVTVTGSVLRLGDLFTNAGPKAGEPIAPAPALGTHVTYSAAWLGAVARERQLSWTPSSDFDQATVERASRSIGASLITQRLLRAIPAAVQAADADIQLDNGSLRLLVPAEASDDIDVDGLNLDPRSGRFSAIVSAPAGSADAQRQRVTGRLVIDVSIAVPTRNISINDIVGRGDVEQIKLSRERLAADTIVDPAQLIGKSARHALRAGQPLRAGDVQEPVVVHKGDLVSIELRTLAMQLSTQGKALEDGVLGASVRVINTQSNRTIDVIVAGPNLVRAAAPDTLAAR